MTALALRWFVPGPRVAARWRVGAMGAIAPGGQVPPAPVLAAVIAPPGPPGPGVGDPGDLTLIFDNKLI